MIVVVTGGAGFLGARLCEALLRGGARVVCLDDLSTGLPRRVDELLTHDDFQFEQHDVRQPYFYGADRIYNLACPASPKAYQADPEGTMMTNVFGMLEALRSANRSRARVLQASTSEIYGDPEVTPQTEEYRGSVSVTGPRACYDEGKRAAETICADAVRGGRDVRVARIFNTYGPGMRADDGRVVSNYITQALRGEPITVYGDGTQTRSFCYVDDMIAGLIGLMEAPSNPGPCNLGAGKEDSMGELAQLVRVLVGSDSQVVLRPLPVDDPRRRQPDTSRAKAAFGFRAPTHFRTGLLRTIEYFRRTL